MKQDILQFAAIAQLLAYKDVKSIPIPYAITQMFLKLYFIYETKMIFLKKLPIYFFFLQWIPLNFTDV